MSGVSTPANYNPASVAISGGTITGVTINAASDANMPPGTIIKHSGTTAPAGFLACPVAQTNLSRTTYAALFAAIGTTYGAGDGSTTFGMPWIPADYVPVQANANVGTSTVGQVIAHAHNVQVYAASAGNNLVGEGAGGTSYAVPSASTGGSANLAAGVRFLYCVKY